MVHDVLHISTWCSTWCINGAHDKHMIYKWWSHFSPVDMLKRRILIQSHLNYPCWYSHTTRARTESFWWWWWGSYGCFLEERKIGSLAPGLTSATPMDLLGLAWMILLVQVLVDGLRPEKEIGCQWSWGCWQPSTSHSWHTPTPSTPYPPNQPTSTRASMEATVAWPLPLSICSGGQDVLYGTLWFVNGHEITQVLATQWQHRIRL